MRQVPEKDVAKFYEFLKNKNLKLTSERKKILHEVHSYHSHFQAEDLLFSMRKNGSNVSKATIYRTLPVLIECGLLRKVHRSDKQMHYEYIRDNTGCCHHMICINCGSISKFSDKAIDETLLKLAEKNNFTMQTHIIEIEGYCEDCKFAIPRK